MGNVTRKSAYKGIELKCRDSDRVKTFCDAATDSSIKLELRWTKWDRENLLHETLHEFEKKVYTQSSLHIQSECKCITAARNALACFLFRKCCDRL